MAADVVPITKSIGLERVDEAARLVPPPNQNKASRLVYLFYQQVLRSGTPNL